MENKADRQPQSDELILLADPVPNTIQLYALFAFAVGAIATYFVTSTLFELGSCSLLGVVFSVMGGATASYITEYILQKTWKSDRFLHVTDSKMSFVFADKEARAIDPSQEIRVTAWYFAIKRRSRVPKGWMVVGLALEQDDVYLPVYALVSPQTFEDMESRPLFHHLEGSRRDYKVSSETARLAGEQRRILIAETARSIDGVELFADDFERLIAHLQSRFPAWMPRI
jgi:hypothetical protein